MLLMNIAAAFGPAAAFVATSPSSPPLVPSPDYIPALATGPAREMSICTAMVTLSPELIATAEACELKKLLGQYDACRKISPDDIQPSATKVYAHFLCDI